MFVGRLGDHMGNAGIKEHHKVSYDPNFRFPQTGRQLYHVPVTKTSIRSVRYSPDSRLLATAGDDETVTVWDAETATKIKYATKRTVNP